MEQIITYIQSNITQDLIASLSILNIEIVISNIIKSNNIFEIYF